MFAAAHTQRESCDLQHIPYAIISGGRLIFTNLAQRSAFPASGSEAGDLPQGAPSIPDVRLPYVVVQDSSVLLSAAAALSANFPPVFTNARVDVPAAVPDSHCPTRAYYVTDGGAVENLGLLSALYALRQALNSLRNAPATESAALKPKAMPIPMAVHNPPTITLDNRSPTPLIAASAPNAIP